jgi:hypothetical protein
MTANGAACANFGAQLLLSWLLKLLHTPRDLGQHIQELCGPRFVHSRMFWFGWVRLGGLRRDKLTVNP